MTKTPLTDAIVNRTNFTLTVLERDLADHARDLETKLSAARRDAERLDWLLKYAYARSVGAGADDWDYHPIKNREQIDTAMQREANEHR